MEWAETPKPKDYKAADGYLRLAYEPAQAARLSRKLREAEPEEHRASDVLRACGLEPLSTDDPRVVELVKTLQAGKPLRPPLIVATSRGTELANGYHHLSIAYHSDPAGPIPIVIARDF